MKRYLLSLFITLTPWLPSISHAENLLDTFELAYLYDTDLRIAESQRLIGREFRPAALSVLLPQLNATANQTSRDFGGASEFNVGSTVFREHGYDVNLNQSILNFSQWFDLSQANSLVSQADAEYRIVEQSLIFLVAQAYFLILENQDLLELARAQKNAIGQQLEQTQQFFEVGLVAITDVNEAQARYDLAVADEIFAANELENSRAALSIITNQAPGTLDILIDNIPLAPPEPANVEEWIDSTITYNPLLTSNSYSIDAAASGVKSAKSQHLPFVFASADYGHQRLGTLSNNLTNFSRSWSLSLNVGLNIFSGGLIQSNVRTSQYVHQESKDIYEQNLRITTTQTANAYRAVLTAIGQVNAFRQAVVSSRTALEATQAAYDVGTRTIFDVLDSIATLYLSEQQYSQSRYAYILSQLQLKLSAGIVTVNDIMQINELLHPPTGEERLYMDMSNESYSTINRADS